MKPPERLVRIVAREGVDLAKLALNPDLENACGAVGGLIVRDVIAKGSANVPRSFIRMATDTQFGVAMIFDHFVLMDAKTLDPLVNALIKASEFPTQRPAKKAGASVRKRSKISRK